MTEPFESPGLNDRSAKAIREAKAEDQPEFVVKENDSQSSPTDDFDSSATDGANDSPANDQDSSPADDIQVAGSQPIHLEADNGYTDNESGSSKPQPEFPDFGERYEVAERIGQGGMGSVYKVVDKETGMAVAIKSLHVNLAKDATALKRFEMEADAASQLTHPNLISVLGRGTSKDGTPFIVMEFLEGRSLASVLEEEGALSSERATNLFLQIAEGLAYVHEKGIIHRDVKPTNVILTKVGDVETARLVDFGIASILPSGTRETVDLTKTGDVFGSPQYMSPEQCLGFLLDQRSDVYSFGCLMYEVIAGHPPFDGKTPVQLVVEHINSEAPPFSRALKTNKTIAKLEGVILRCLEKEQSLRFQSASELLADLWLVKDGKPVPKYAKSDKVKPILTKRQALGALAVLFVSLFYIPRLSILPYSVQHQFMSFVQLLICFGGSWAFLSVGAERLKKLHGSGATARQWSFNIALCSIGLFGCSLLPYLLVNSLSARYGLGITVSYGFNGLGLQEIENLYWPSVVIFWSTIVGSLFAVIAVLSTVVGVFWATGKKVRAAAVWLRISMLAVIILSAIFFGFPKEASKLVHVVAFQAERAYPKTSLNLFRLSSQLDKDDADALMSIVRIEGRNKNYQGAIDALREVLERGDNSKRPYCYLERASFYMKLAQYDKAETDASKAISLGGRDHFGYNLRGEIRLKRNDFAGALSDFDTSIKLSPDSRNSAYFGRVAAFCAQKKWESALSALEDMVAITEISPAAYLVRGLVYQNLDREDLAKFDFENVVSGYDSNRVVYSGHRVADMNLVASFVFRKLGEDAKSMKALKGYNLMNREEFKEWNSELLDKLKSGLYLDAARIPVKF